MPLARDIVTNIVFDAPQNIIDHRVLGKNLELYVEGDPEFEEDKVVHSEAVSTQRLDKTATKRAVEPASNPITKD